jgi:hypothetical protein
MYLFAWPIYSLPSNSDEGSADSGVLLHIGSLAGRRTVEYLKFNTNQNNRLLLIIYKLTAGISCLDWRSPLFRTAKSVSNLAKPWYYIAGDDILSGCASPMNGKILLFLHIKNLMKNRETFCSLSPVLPFQFVLIQISLVMIVLINKIIDSRDVENHIFCFNSKNLQDAWGVPKGQWP